MRIVDSDMNVWRCDRTSVSHPQIFIQLRNRLRCDEELLLLTPSRSIVVEMSMSLVFFRSFLQFPLRSLV
jgi:hypothetical protein